MKNRYLLFIFLFGLVSLLSGCKEQSLLTNLDQRQATEIQAVLQKHQIPSTRTALGKGLFDIAVKQENVALAIQILEEYQLPTVARIEVTQLFPSDALVSSPQAEKARLISAIEQRLEQSLLVIDHIIDARVHISYPLSPAERTIPKPHSSALVFYEDSIINSDQLGEDIRSFIHNAFSDMDEDNITVLLYPRNINKFNVIKEKSPSENSFLFSNLWVFFALLLVGVVIIFTVIFMFYRHKKMTLIEKENEPNN
ncbi:type III secretion system inner membrane ring lipoprotein SctJ [Proteus hauseri]|uniref:type III secretion system inner membrane ring lipoprotein SctJ n=1 Tax=Proteus hauseri TaxID=183417 RepID=UPI00100950CC|nr:type III secretion inner membrane ring lipoprotein SctJ [Proteus hauseri]QAV22744.1 EscJ/YscJ/HrcJ family type III secretion inner membrane ring protein [Proteus hauseri]